MRLRGATALVTGCSTGIGRATVAELTARGAEVWAATRHPAALDALASASVQVVSLDITSTNEVLDLIGRIGAVDILVNNAGYGVEGSVEEISDSELRAQYEINVFAPLRTQ